MKKILEFFDKKIVLPLIAALAAGLYPWAFYYTTNFNFVNSWDHFFFFLTRFILIPLAVFYLFYFLMRKKKMLLYKRFLLPFLNGFAFFYLVAVALYTSVDYKKLIVIMALAFFVALLCGYIKKLFQKILIIQFILVLTTGYTLAVIAKKYLFDSRQWLEQPDAIMEANFKTFSDVYVIQPDGYVNFSELGRGYYDFDNSVFESWLKEKGFTLYNGFRSNYTNTLHSNSSMFAMKHHYYDVLDERKVIMEENPVVAVFKRNGYKTHFLSEIPYLITNRPDVSFDYMNFKMDEIPYLSHGLDMHRDILEDLPDVLANRGSRNFFFIQKILPGHISTYEDVTMTAEQEGERYLENLKHANDWLQKLLLKIEKSDPDALVILVADHGGFVGMEYTTQTKIKNLDRDKVYSVFSSALAVKWPEDGAPRFDDKFVTSVNLFRILFAQLGDDVSLIKHLQDDASYIEIEEGAPRGIYKNIDAKGNIVFDKHR